MTPDLKIIGIDLGTTNSVVAVIEGDEPIVIPNQEGSNKTPSVVAFLDDDECIVGDIARRQAATNPDRTVSSIKRLMGMDFDDVAETLDIFPFNVVDHEGHVLVDIGGLGYTPEQISALILKKLKESAETYLGEEIKQAVLTVPANFDDSQRNATIEAATLAGLEVLRLINEPTAAALAYGVGRSRDEDEVIAVYDFGGGTFDITILEISEKTFEVLTSTGDDQLGGDDLDQAIVNMIVEEFEEQHNVDLTRDPVTLRRLKEVAEKAKCELSTTSSTTIALPFIAYRDGQPLHLERTLEREELEEIIEPFVNRTVRACKRAIEDAGLNKRDIHKVILVGGSTRIPLVQDAVEDFFGLQPFKGINPDEVVALGAATQGGVFSGNIEEVTLLDVAPHSLGIEVKDGKFSKIIEKNSTLPIKAAKNFTTTEDNQTFVNVHILQGESEESAENRSLGKFILSDIPPASKGQPRIRVTFFLNADGVMEISAEELGSGSAKTLTILHSELDEKEKKSRRKARQRRRGGGRSSRETSRRYSRDTAGAPKSLKGRRSTTSSGPGGTATKDGSSSGIRQRHDDSSSIRTRNADSSIAPMGGEENFAVLGDTNPGTAPTSHISGHSSREAIPLKPRSDDEETVPRRYGQSGTAMPPPSSQPPREMTPAPVDDDGDFPQVPIPPSIPPQRDDFTAPYVSDTSKFETRIQNVEEVHQSLGDEGVHLEMQTEEIGLPGILDAALEYAERADSSPEATDIYTKALETLAEGPWNEDTRFPVLRARALMQLSIGQVEEARSSLQIISRQHHEQFPKATAALFDSALARFPSLAELRRDRALFRETLGDFVGACEDIEQASKIDPAANDANALERLYKARVDRDNDHAAKFKLVKIYLKSNRIDDAIELLQVLQDEETYRSRALKILGLCHWQKNLHFLAWQKFKQLEQNDEIRDILYRLAADMESTGQLNNALTVLEHIAAENENYRDVTSKVKKLRYRIKIQQEEADNTKAAILSDPRFVILEEINRGSMGIIYKARDKTLEEVVALKVLNDYLCADPSAVERFKREARAAKKLSHPYIVRIHDMFESGSKRFISMEFIEGTDLKRMLSERTSFTEEQLVYYFLQICDALSYAHKLNIIHRDIKPANVMITKEHNAVKVTDFGIAKILKSDDSTKSGTAVIGTPLYMAPEQITGEGVDPRTDIYALGIMMYELVSGHPPFYLGNIEYHHIHTAPPPLPEKVSPKLRDVIMKCVSKSPDDRFQSVDEIFDELEVSRR